MEGKYVTPENNPRRIKFKFRPDWIHGRYFYFTYLLGMYFVSGGIAGYAKRQNLFCLIISSVLGIGLLLLAIGHTIDYYNGAVIEALYTSAPCIISLLSGIFLTVIYFLGTRFSTSIYIAIPLWISFVFYAYALIKDHGDGQYYRENTFVPRPVQNEIETTSLLNPPTTSINQNEAALNEDRRSRVAKLIQRLKSSK